ncbi:MAG: hypothetical protein FWC00_03460 [Firmicutes bacterium]|nr:hypothetical protein [Bacillota bacterium]
MSDKKKPASKPKAEKQSDFTPTFIRYDDMSPREQGIFRQGATTANNSVKERLGLRKPIED